MVLARCGGVCHERLPTKMGLFETFSGLFLLYRGSNYNIKLRIIYRDRGEIVWMQQLAILRRDQVAERAEGSTNVLQTVGTNQIRQTGRE